MVAKSIDNALSNNQNSRIPFSSRNSRGAEWPRRRTALNGVERSERNQRRKLTSGVAAKLERLTKAGGSLESWVNPRPVFLLFRGDSRSFE